MSFLSNFRADRLITQIKSSNDILGTETQKSVTKLKGEVKLVQPGSLPNDGKMIADERPVG